MVRMGLFQRKTNETPREPFSLRLPKQASSVAPEGVYTNAGALGVFALLSFDTDTRNRYGSDSQVSADVGCCYVVDFLAVGRGRSSELADGRVLTFLPAPKRAQLIPMVLIGASIIPLGLSWKDAIAIVVVGTVPSRTSARRASFLIPPCVSSSR